MLANVTDSLPYFATSHPLVLAHRGFSLTGLENTMAAFREAVDLGCTHVETDAQATADGVVLLFHDSTLDRVTGSSGKISALPARVVARARIGGSQAIPTLEELASKLPDVRINLDVKEWNSVAPVAGLIERLGLHDRVLVASFSDRRRRAVQQRLSRPVAGSAGVVGNALFVLLAPVVPQRFRASVMARLLPGVDALQIPERFGPVRTATRGLVHRAHSCNLQVHVWTVNEPVVMHALLDLGFDGIVTDRADLLMDVLRERGSRKR